MDITIYGKADCSFCTAATAYLSEKEIPFLYIDIEQNGFDKVNLVKFIAPGATTVPIVILNGEWIGGYSEMKVRIHRILARAERFRELLGMFDEVDVVFTKKDGTLREMRCTINLDLVPIEHHPKNGVNSAAKIANPYLTRVYDLDAKGWRSVDGLAIQFVVEQNLD